MLILSCIAELASDGRQGSWSPRPVTCGGAPLFFTMRSRRRDLCRCVAVVDWSDGGSVAQLRAATAALHTGASRRALGCAPRRQCRRAACADFCWPRFRYSHRQSMGNLLHARCATATAAKAGHRALSSRSSTASDRDRDACAAEERRDRHLHPGYRRLGRPGRVSQRARRGIGRDRRGLAHPRPLGPPGQSSRDGRNLPLANQRNFAAAVHALSEIMDKESDVLLLLMTSHGEPARLRAAAAKRGRSPN